MYLLKYYDLTFSGLKGSDNVLVFSDPCKMVQVS